MARLLFVALGIFPEAKIENRSVHLPLIYVESELREKFSEKTELVFQSITNPSHFQHCNNQLEFLLRHLVPVLGELLFGFELQAKLVYLVSLEDCVGFKVARYARAVVRVVRQYPSSPIRYL